MWKFFLSQESFPVEMCRTVIDLARSNPVLPVPDRISEEERDKSRAACSASVVHQVNYDTSFEEEHTGTTLKRTTSFQFPCDD